MLRKIIFVIPVIFVLVFVACKNNVDKKNEAGLLDQNMSTTLKLNEKTFKGNDDAIKLFTIKNKNNLSATFTNYGQRLVTLMVPDKDGNLADIVLGFYTLDEYKNASENYFGSSVGRYGNRIAKGKFSIDGETYTLATNNGENHLHGGAKGFNDEIWKGVQLAENKLEFSRLSPDMEEGYPGNLNVKVTYTLTNENELVMKYEATTDKPTVVNLTHHSFFNLKGDGEGSINNHILTINANAYTPVNKTLIPTGEIESVVGTPFDFTSPKTIGRDLEIENEQLSNGFGYDHNFVLNEEPKNEAGLIFAARVEEPEHGRVMEIYTNEPGLQFYGGNFLDGKTVGKSGKPYNYRGAFCLETQHFPDSPNQTNFPSTLLKPGEKYNSVCIYKFGIIGE
ncbi:galactose mutarotase [Lutibacter sp. HS1-25]|uniref:aldose epimerase family protein n=1 Tax=Lutibacter sp. HS1-25 TaxID=2485000 RepID=UPI0010123169|nr:aldose epimerase family protein [Lutibacter sp. HS1-25]RXP57923.1 galactose mutarotase [Lutibacter sp. HS1-25]